MNLLTEIFCQPFAERLGWVLIHFLWQGATAAALLAVVLRILHATSAEARYLAACVTLILMAAMPVATLMSLSEPHSQEVSAVPVAPQTPRGMQTNTVPGTSAPTAKVDPQEVEALENRATNETPLATIPVPAASSASWADRIGQRLRPWTPWFTAGWLVGVLFFSLRLLGSWRSARRIRLTGISAAATRLESLVQQLSKQLGVRLAVRLLESTVAEVPMALGWLQPVILLPVSAVTGLSESQIKAILAHELAHIRRGDYLVNLVQSVVETLLFYHPAVWWVSARIRQEREHCCDDLAGNLCGDRIGYAQALVRMEELRRPSGSVTLAASGGRLTQRVRRLVGAKRNDNLGAWWLGGVAAIAIAAGIVMTLWWTTSVTASPMVTREVPEMALAQDEAVKTKEPPAKIENPAAKPWLTVKAYDKATGNPIERFRVIPGVETGGSGYGPYSAPKDPGTSPPGLWLPGQIREGTNGRLDWFVVPLHKKICVQVEADGYIPFLSKWIESAEGGHLLGVTLTRDRGITGRVISPDGRPAARAVLAVTMPGRDAQIDDGKFLHRYDPPPATAAERWQRPIFAVADSNGRYQLDTQIGAVLVYVLHESGIVELPFDRLQKTPNIQLQQWAAIDGRVVWADKPGANEEMLVSVRRSFGDYPYSLSFRATATTDAQGRFRLDRLPPWPARLSRRFELPDDRGEYLYPTLDVELTSGEAREVIFGGRGRTVMGKLVGLDSWEGRTLEIAPHTPGAPGGYDDWLARAVVYQSSFGPILFRNKIPIGEDGSFQIKNVLPAHYSLTMRAGASDAFAGSRFTIEPADEGDSSTPLDLGEIQARRIRR